MGNLGQGSQALVQINKSYFRCNCCIDARLKKQRKEEKSIGQLEFERFFSFYSCHSMELVTEYKKRRRISLTSLSLQYFIVSLI
jgi:hypothetical protein